VKLKKERTKHKTDARRAARDQMIKECSGYKMVT